MICTSALIIYSLGFTSCEDDSDPYKLSFQDIYGREDWEVKSDYPSGYYFIERSKDMQVEKLSTSESTGDSYKITLDGASPSFSSQRLLTQLNGMVLSFVYTSSEKLQVSISMDNTDKIVNSKLFDMEATSTPKEYSFDLGILIDNGNWGGVASSYTISFEQNDGAELTIDKMQIRQRNQAEINAATKVHYIEGFFGEGGKTVITYETEIFTYGKSAFRYHPTNNEWNNNQAQSDLISENLPRTYDKFSFEYKSATNFTMWFFYVASEPGRMTISRGAATDWTKVTVNLNAASLAEGGPDNATPTGRLNDIWNAGAPPAPRRFRIDISAGGQDVLLRGVSLHE